MMNKLHIPNRGWLTFSHGGKSRYILLEEAFTGENIIRKWLAEGTSLQFHEETLSKELVRRRAGFLDMVLHMRELGKEPDILNGAVYEPDTET